MTILIDKQINALCENVFNPMIFPYLNQQIKVDEKGNKVISSGLSSAGYDVRLAKEFKVFTNLNSVMVDPLNFDSKSLVDMSGDYCIVPPNSYILGRTVETFAIPDDIMVICVGKSTYARAGILINTTPIEPGFHGEIVIEIANCTSLPVKVYANQGIAQFIFFKGNEPCETSYAKRAGKYMYQQGITLPKG